jgi:hypothetical protein
VSSGFQTSGITVEAIRDALPHFRSEIVVVHRFLQ